MSAPRPGSGPDGWESLGDRLVRRRALACKWPTGARHDPGAAAPNVYQAESDGGAGGASGRHVVRPSSACPGHDLGAASKPIVNAKGEGLGEGVDRRTEGRLVSYKQRARSSSWTETVRDAAGKVRRHRPARRPHTPRASKGLS